MGQRRRRDPVVKLQETPQQTTRRQFLASLFPASMKTASTAQPGNISIPPTSRRTLLKIGIVAAVATAFGGAGKYIFDRIRFDRWKRNTELHFGYGGHGTAEHGLFYAQIVERAKQAGNPFHFLVLEAGESTRKKRAQQEEMLNRRLRETREEFYKKYGSDEKKLDAKILEKIKKIGYDDFDSTLLLTAIKHGLIVKFAEEYQSEEQIQRMIELKARGDSLINKNTPEQSTRKVHDSIAQGMQLYQEWLSLRNKTIAEITSKTAAEIRRDFPEFRGKKIKGLVQLGSAHAATDEEVQGKNIVNLTTSEEISKEIGLQTAQISLSQSIFHELHFRPESIGSPESVGKCTIALFLNPIYRGYLKRNQTEKRKRMSDAILSLKREKIESILKATENLTEEPRARAIMQML